MLVKEEPHLARGFLPHRGADMIRKKSGNARHRREFARKCLRTLVIRRLHGLFFNYAILLCAGRRVRSGYVCYTSYQGGAT